MPTLRVLISKHVDSWTQWPLLSKLPVECLSSDPLSNERESLSRLQHLDLVNSRGHRTSCLPSSPNKNPNMAPMAQAAERIMYTWCGEFEKERMNAFLLTKKHLQQLKTKLWNRTTPIPASSGYVITHHKHNPWFRASTMPKHQAKAMAVPRRAYSGVLLLCEMLIQFFSSKTHTSPETHTCATLREITFSYVPKGQTIAAKTKESDLDSLDDTPPA